jgi:feruloyl esterase
MPSLFTLPLLLSRSCAVVLCSLASVLAAAQPAAGATCESLTSLSIAPGSGQGRVSLAQMVAPGTFPPPAGRAGGPPASGNPFAALPAFCRVAVTLHPASRSDIKAEVWLPAAGWNGKLQVVGNGGFAGTVSYPAMATALAAGYATASTDTGHTGPAANTFATEDATIDFAYRAIHETTVAAKKVVDGFYGAAPRFSYFNGCSTGGRQALTAAQRYPEDFNGIVGGAPATFSSKQAFGQIWFYQAIALGAGAIPKESLPLIHEAVLDACDQLDGARDGVLENPLACRFDPGVLACKAGAAANGCLTPPQVDAVRKVYAGAANTTTGEKIFPGLERGSELGWSPVPVSYAVDYFKHVVFKNPSWDASTLNFGTDVAEAYPASHLIFDANDPRLSAFTGRGGKLLMYQGWAEPGIPPGNIVSYYAKVQAQTLNAKEAVRLFMVPGMGHCGGGDGASTFNMVAALDAWVEKGAAPEQVPASRLRNGKVDRTRPLCAYPFYAHYKGSGSLDDAASFACQAPKP